MKKALVLAFVLGTSSVGLSSVALADLAPEPREKVEATEAGGEEEITSPIQNVGSFDYKGKNAEGGELKEGEHRMPPPFAMVLVNFAILLIILAKTAWPGIKKATADRSDNLAKALNEGKRLRAEAQAKLDEYTQKLATMQSDIEKMTSAIRAEAEAEQKRLIAEAETRAQRMQKEAEQQIDAEIRRVRGLLEREVAMIAVATAEKILRENTTETDQRTFADRFVAELGAATKRPPTPAA